MTATIPAVFVTFANFSATWQTSLSLLQRQPVQASPVPVEGVAERDDGIRQMQGGSVDLGNLTAVSAKAEEPPPLGLLGGQVTYEKDEQKDREYIFPNRLHSNLFPFGNNEYKYIL